jgi:hypothetical protein
MLSHGAWRGWFQDRSQNDNHQPELAMQDDERCCGTGTCIIDAQGLCWCGQQWDGEKMCRPALAGTVTLEAPAMVPAEKEADHE